MSKITFTEETSKPSPPSTGQLSIYGKTDNILYIQDSTGSENPVGQASGITSITGDVTATGPGAATATVVTVGGASASSILSSVTLTSSATSSNTPSTIVKRDGSGNFTAGIVTATLVGTASGNLPLTGGSLSGALSVTSSSGTAFTVDTNVFVVDDAVNQVGINKVNPSQALDVVGNGNFSGTLTAANFSGSNTGDVTLGTSSGLSISSQVLSLGLASASTTGALSLTDWNTFNNKLSGSGTANLTDSGTDGITISGGTGAVIGTGTTIAQHVADASHNGYLSSVDWSAFNNKQATGNYITSLTGDGTATGPGSATFTLATVSSGGTSPKVTFNSKGLVTAGAALSSSDIPNNSANTSGTASNITGTSNSTLTTLSSLSLPYSQITGAPNSITALTGDATASGPGSSVITLTTVNSNVGSFGSSSSVNTITVNSKGLITSVINNPIQITETQVTNLTTDLAGKQPVGNYVTGLTGDVLANGPGSVAATIQPNVVTNSKLAQMNANTIKGNNTLSSANSLDLTSAQVTAMLNPFVGDSGTGGIQGLVPAPASGQYESGSFLNAGGNFSVVDQSKPRYSSFSLVNKTAQPSGTLKFQSVTIAPDGVHAYVAGGQNVMSVYNISNQASPKLEGTISLLGSYRVEAAVIASTPYMIVPSSGGSTLYIVNVSNPNSLSITSSLAISGGPGSLYECVYSAGYVYISTQSKGLTVVDIGGGAGGGTITTPVQVYQEGGTTNKSFGIAVSGSTLYTTNYDTAGTHVVKYFKTWDISNPIAPNLLNTFTFPGNTKPNSIVLSGTNAYVTDTSLNQIIILDITSPSSPSQIGTFTPTYTLGSVGSVIISNNPNFVYITSGQNATNGGALDLFDVTNKSAPIKVSSVFSGVASSPFGSGAINNGYIYIADYGAPTGTTGSLDVYSTSSESQVFGTATGSSLSLKSLTSGSVIVTDSSDNLVSSLTTATELSYVHGVTSNIQTQINSISASAGITRSINNIATATTAGASPNTDYVYFVSGTTTLTLPTAVGNKNRYVVKNVGSTTVTISTTSSQTIDGSNSASIPKQYTSLDLISDGSNWNII